MGSTLLLPLPNLPGAGDAMRRADARTAALFLDGHDSAAIVQTLRGVKSSDGGRRYQKALTEGLDLIRQGLGR